MTKKEKNSHEQRLRINLVQNDDCNEGCTNGKFLAKKVQLSRTSIDEILTFLVSYVALQLSLSIFITGL